MAKSEQINLRISSTLKKQLSEVSEEQDMSMSDFIRQTLEERFQGSSEVKERIAELEQKMEANWQKLFRRMLYAGATIGSIDTGHPLDHCMKTVLDIIEDLGIDFIQLVQSPRSAMETNYLDMQDAIQQALGLSELAVAFLSAMFSSVNAMRYDEEVFGLSPLSIKTLERVRMFLEMEKRKNDS